MTQINAEEPIPSPTKGHNSRHNLSERQRKSLEYMGSIIGELSVMAKGERAQMIAYFLEMAYIETFDVLRGQRPLTGKDQETTSSPNAQTTAELYKIG